MLDRRVEVKTPEELAIISFRNHDEDQRTKACIDTKLAKQANGLKFTISPTDYTVSLIIKTEYTL